MGLQKRLFDLSLALVLTGLVLPLGLLLAACLLLRQGRPIFYVADRVGQNGRVFRLWKFRTMRPATDHAPDLGTATGGDSQDRITTMGRWMRRRRMDELPQLWNILRGDMSFVGPRPPLARYVARHGALYKDVLQQRPGLMGLATLLYHRREAELLAPCRSAEETDELYSRICVPQKARLDRFYARRVSLGLDLWVIWRTFRAVAEWTT